jgi:erythromycin esterase-like protein
MQKMRVPDAREGSYEHAMHSAQIDDSLFLFPQGDGDGATNLREERGHRAIGVVYNPRTEHWGNYVPTILPGRYDAFIYLEETKALDPLHMPVRVDGEVPETFPFGQ